MRRTLVLSLTAFLAAPVAIAWAEPPPAKDDKPAKDPKEAAKEADLKIRQLINSAGPAFDACTQRYIGEYPAADGKADISLVVLKTGMVEKATVELALEGARNLKPCLEQVGKGLKFPQAVADGATLKITVPVKKGDKFRIPLPGEEQKPGEEKQSENGFIQFLPADWKPQ